MTTLTPIYTSDNCTFCAPLRWGLTVFWRSPVTESPWFDDLVHALQPDGIRLLGHRFSEHHVSQFSLATLPSISPMFTVNRVKGRLQYLVRGSMPKAFQRNYALRSFGHATREAVEHYVASQLDHHRMADEHVQSMLERFQIVHPDVNLSRHQSTSHAIYWYNLHVVIVHRERSNEIDERVLDRVKTMVEQICRAKTYLLSRAGILTDHVHLTVGCPIDAAPQDVALAFLNNLAFAHGMKAVFQFGAYIGTFGEYHAGAVMSDATQNGDKSGEPDHRRGGGL
jgi:REP element-mobilizing transposase RayT